MQRDSVVVLGGSGNVGKEAVKALVASNIYSQITLIARRPLPEIEALHPSIKVFVCDLDRLESVDLKGHTAAVMALGAGKASELSQDELYRVDVTIPVSFSKRCRADGVRHMTVLSAVGADHTAKYCALTKTGAGGGWYSHCKGMLEKLIFELGFESLSVFRPATIIGNTNTPGFISWLNPKIDWMLPDKYNSINCGELGARIVRALNQQVRGEWSGYRLYEGASLHDSL